MQEPLLFHWADYLVFVILLTASASVGFVIGWRDRKETSAKDFLIGGRSMHWLPTAFSLQTTFINGVFITSTPVEIYCFGTMFSYIVVGCGLAYPFASHIFLAMYYKLNIVSAYEYLERRFNKVVRVAGSVTFCVMILLNNSVLLYTPSIALAQVTGLSIDISILLCGSICTLYTTMGGMKATIWIDFIQMIVVFVSLTTVIALGSWKVRGISEVWKANLRGGRIIFDNFEIDPTLRTTFWTQVIGAGTGAFALRVSSQVIVQKFISVKSLKDAHKSMYFNIVTNLVFAALATLVGMVAYAYFEGCDPVLSGKTEKFDQIVPLLVMEVAGNFHGIPGVFMATIFYTALSFLSGGLTSLSAVTMIDFIQPLYFHYKKRPMAEFQMNILSRAFVFIYGVLAIGSGYVAQFAGNSILQITTSIFGFVGGPLVSLVVLGVLFPFVNSWGVLAGLVSSLAVCSWIAIGAVLSKSPLPILKISSDKCSVGTLNDTLKETISFWPSPSTLYDVTTSLASSPPSPADLVPWYYRISYFYYTLISLVVAIAVAVPVSIITGRAKKVDPNLTFNYFGKCCCCCPQPCESCLKCGTAFEGDVEAVEDEGRPNNEVTFDGCHVNPSFRDDAYDHL